MPNQPHSRSIKEFENESWDIFEDKMGIGEVPGDINTLESAPNGQDTSNTNFGIPVQDELVILTCNHCSKPILQSAFTSHLGGTGVDNCPGLVEEKKTPIKSLKLKKKRKGNDSASPKGKVTKLEKGKKVLNLDVQCGVKTDQGTICMRAITCKIHPVSSKRAVEGRTRGYDELVQEYQMNSVISRGGKFEPKESKNSKQKNGGGSKSKGVCSGANTPSRNPSDRVVQETEVLEIMKCLQTFKPTPLVVSESYNTLEMWKAHKSHMALVEVFQGVSSSAS